MKHLQGAPLTVEEVRTLELTARELSGFRIHEQELAIALLADISLSEEQQASVKALFMDILNAKQWKDNLSLFLMRLVLLGLIFGWITFLLTADSVLAQIFGVSLLAWGYLPFYPLHAAWEDRKLNRLRAEVMRACGQLRLLSMLDAVADGVFYAAGLQQTLGCRKVREAAIQALPEMLAALTPEHYGQLPAGTTPALCRVLYHPDNRLVALALDALGKVGDGRAVAPVEQMVRRGRTPELRAEAERILPVLQERKRQEEAHSSLLRPSGVPADTPDVLLRPAAAQSHVDPETLLRTVETAGEHVRTEVTIGNATVSRGDTVSISGNHDSKGHCAG
ncbi:MAG: HEAT repeat domain-containing protein [Chloroherpetonaceae bacterium]|nr:HEAT repeat domain-containing protein [Chloroherpetonaceae bacterium]